MTKGILAFDVFCPKFEMLRARLGEEILEIEWADPSAPKRIVRRYYRKDVVDKIHQIYALTFLLRTYEAGDLVREECESLTLSYYTYPHLRLESPAHIASARASSNGQLWRSMGPTDEIGQQAFCPFRCGPSAPFSVARNGDQLPAIPAGPARNPTQCQCRK